MELFKIFRIIFPFFRLKKTFQISEEIWLMWKKFKCLNWFFVSVSRIPDLILKILICWIRIRPNTNTWASTWTCSSRRAEARAPSSGLQNFIPAPRWAWSPGSTGPPPSSRQFGDPDPASFEPSFSFLASSSFQKFWLDNNPNLDVEAIYSTIAINPALLTRSEGRYLPVPAFGS